MNMFGDFNKKKLFEFIIYTISVVVFIMIGFYFTALLNLLIFFSIILLANLGVRSNERVIVLSAVISASTVFILTGQIMFAINSLITISIPGIAAGYAFRQKLGLRDIFILISSAYLFSLLAVIIMGSHLEGVNQIDKLMIEPAKEIFIGFYQDFKNKITVLENSGIDIGRLDLIRKYVNVSDVMYAFKLIIPGILIVSSAFLSYITLMSIKTLLIKTKHDFSHLPAFYELRVSRGTVLIFVVIFILLLFVKQSKIYAALVNINLILYSVFIFIGVSVIDFFARRTRVPGIIRTIIYFPIFIILSVVGLLLPFLHPFNFLIIVSVTDSVFDFRKLRARGEKDGK